MVQAIGLTKEELQERRKHIGASDMAAIMGLSEHQSPVDVWLDKTGQVPLEKAVGQAAYAGNRFEPSVLDEAESVLGPLERKVRIVHPGGILAASLDARLIETGEPVQAKTAGLFAPLSAEWGEPETDKVPKAYIIQEHVEMMCAGAGLAYLMAFLGGKGFNLYRIQRSEKLTEAIGRAAEDFWRHVEDGTPPEGQAHIETLKFLSREPESVAKIGDDVLAEWLEQKENLKLAEDAENEARVKLLTSLGKAEAAVSPTLGGVTFLEQSRKEYVVAAATFRVLRYKKPK